MSTLEIFENGQKYKRKDNNHSKSQDPEVQAVISYYHFGTL